MAYKRCFELASLFGQCLINIRFGEMEMYTYTSYRYGHKLESNHKSITKAIEEAKICHDMELAAFGSITRNGIVIIDSNQFMIELEHLDDD